MKCVRNVKTEEIVRVENDRAAALVASGKWKYASKLDWKESGRQYSTSKVQVESYSEGDN